MVLLPCSRVGVIVLVFSCTVSVSHAQLVFDDPLTNGATIGVRDNGQGQFLLGQGWKVTSYSDNIRYTRPTPIEDGAVEFRVRGLKSSDDLNPDGQLMSMYDASWGNPRFVYWDVRMNPWKFVWHRYGDDGAQYHQDEFKMIMNTQGVNQFEGYSRIGPRPWNENVTYHFRVRWRDGVVRYYLNGVDTDRWPFVYRGVYSPQTHDIRIGTNTRNNAIVNAVYSEVKIYDYGTIPHAPYINNPAGVTTALAPVIDWVGGRHDRFQARVTTGPDPGAGIVRDSGELTSSESYYAIPSALPDNTALYAHVRLRNAKGWGPWSEARPFQTATAGSVRVPRYGEYEILLLDNADVANPYLNVTLSATFVGPSRTITMDGFWDGGRLYKVRMLPTDAGNWTWTTTSNRAALNGSSGGFVCDPSARKGYVRVSPAFRHTFEWAGDGSPFLLLGDTIWHMYYGLRFSEGEFQSLIDARAAQHFTYAHGVVHDSPHNEGGSIYRAQDAGAERGDFDCDTLNPDYFKWLDRKIDYMNGRAMVASLFCSWGNEGYQEYATPQQYLRYLRYMVARYASKNVFWIIVGEYEEAGEPNAQWTAYMDEVYARDPYRHPISMHTVNTTNAFGGVTSHSFVGQQRKGTPEQLRALIASSRTFNKPVVNLEYGYEGDPTVFAANQSADEVRKDHYALMLAGGYGVYGNNVPGYSTYHRVGEFVLTATDTPGAGYMKILYEFFTQTAFHRLEPAQTLVNNGICAAWPDNEYIVQLPSGGSVNVDLTAAGGSFFVDWFNPRSGVRAPSGNTAGGGVRSFTAPASGDWLLHIHRLPIGGGVGALSDFDGDNDVDQADFGFLQSCFSGPGTYYEPGCGPADLNFDGAVDSQDLGLFLGCMSGPGEPPRC